MIKKLRIYRCATFLRNKWMFDFRWCVIAKLMRRTRIISHLQEERGSCMNIISAHRLSAIRHADELLWWMWRTRVSERSTRDYSLLTREILVPEQYTIQREIGGDRMKTLKRLKATSLWKRVLIKTRLPVNSTITTFKDLLWQKIYMIDNGNYCVGGPNRM